MVKKKNLLATAVKERVMKISDSNVYKCKICGGRSMTGETPATKHLEGRDHKREGAKYILLNPQITAVSLTRLVTPFLLKAAKQGVVYGYTCHPCNLNLLGVEPLEAHLKGSEHAKITTTSNTLQVPGRIGVAASAGGTRGRYWCRLCDVDCNSEPDLTKHRLGAKHARKMATPKVTLPSPAVKHPMPAPASSLPNKMLNCDLCGKPFNSQISMDQHKSDKHLEKALLSSEGNSGDDSKRIPTESYSLKSDPRGHVYVFNYKCQYDENPRHGAEKDSENIFSTFTELGYKVILKENLGAQETRDALNTIVRDEELNTVDCLIMFFLSHGSKPYAFKGEDNEELNLKKIRRMFINSKCPQLRSKPKIFFTNFCRGGYDQKPIEYDGELEVLSDAISIHAADEGIKAMRHPDLGTLFVYSLCKVLRSHARSNNLRDIITMVKKETELLRGTMPVQEVNGFREFFFVK